MGQSSKISNLANSSHFTEGQSKHVVQGRQAGKWAQEGTVYFEAWTRQIFKQAAAIRPIFSALSSLSGTQPGDFSVNFTTFFPGKVAAWVKWSLS